MAAGPLTRSRGLQPFLLANFGEYPFHAFG